MLWAAQVLLAAVFAFAAVPQLADAHSGAASPGLLGARRQVSGRGNQAVTPARHATYRRRPLLLRADASGGQGRAGQAARRPAN